MKRRKKGRMGRKKKEGRRGGVAGGRGEFVRHNWCLKTGDRSTASSKAIVHLEKQSLPAAVASAAAAATAHVLRMSVQTGIDKRAYRRTRADRGTKRHVDTCKPNEV